MRLIPFVLTALAMAGCSGTAGADDPTPQGRTLVSVAVDGEQIPGGGPLTVRFDDDRISTYAGCNHGSGTVDLSDGHLVTELASTMMGCPPPLGDADAWMVALFDARPAWTWAGDTLTLRTDAVTVTLRDRKVLDPDRSLTDTTWLVTSVVSAQSVSTSVSLEQARPTVTITSDGAVSGWTGCNQFTGHAGVSGNTLDFGPLVTTKKACPDGLGEVEQAVLRVLNGHVQAAIDADELRLTRDGEPAGYGLILRAAVGR